MKIGTLTVEIRADDGSLNRSLAKSQRSVKSFQKEVKPLSRELDGLSRASRVAAAGITALAGAMVVGRIREYADSWTNVNNRLRQVTRTNEEFLASQKSVFDIAIETRSSVEAVATLYSRTARQADRLGISQDEVATFTRAVNQSFQAYGATAQEASSATLQLSQALAKGVLNGDEFRTITEAAPPILDAIAKAAKKDVGALKDMGAQGTLTADLIVKGVLQAASAFEDDFSRSVAAAASKLEIARTNAIKFVGASSGITGAVEEISDAAVFLSENLDAVATAATLVASVFAGRLTASIVASSQAQLAAIAANKARLASELQVAKQVAHRATQDQLAAQRSLAVAHNDTLRGGAITRLAAANQKAIAAQSGLTAATNAYAAAATKAGIAARGLTGALALVGGPIGVAIIAATAIASFQEELGLVGTPARQATADIGKLRSQLKGLSEAQAEQALTSMRVRLVELQSASADADRAMEKALGEQSIFGKLNPNSESNQAIKRAAELSSELAAQMQRVAAAEKILSGSGDDSEEDIDAKRLEKLQKAFQTEKGLAERFSKDMQTINRARLSGEISSQEEFNQIKFQLEAKHQEDLKNLRLALGGVDKERIQKDLDALREQFATEAELMTEKVQRDHDLLVESLENGLLTKQEFWQLEQDLKQSHEDGLTKIEEKASEARKRIADAEARAKKQGMQSMFNDLTSLMNSQSRKMFELGKAAAIANTIMSTIESAQDAYKWGMKFGGPAAPALAAAAAGAAILAGTARVQQIRSTSFGGGGSAGATGTSAPAATATTGQPGAEQSPRRVFVEGISPDTLINGRQLINILNAAQEDGPALITVGR